MPMSLPSKNLFDDLVYPFGASGAAFGRTSGQQIGAYAFGVPTFQMGGASGNGVALSGGIFGWSSHAANVLAGAVDSALGRVSAGLVEVNNGTAGQVRDIRVRALECTGLPTANPGPNKIWSNSGVLTLGT
jgi:hypothetical protein